MLVRRIAVSCLIGLGSLAASSLDAQSQIAVAVMAPTTSSPAVGASAVVSPAAVPPVDNRWADSFAAFAAADKLKVPAQGGVLFVGSSSIRLWNSLETDFQALPVVQRGFGGSRMLDCTEYLQRLVTPFKPHLVLVYAGDNDLAEGRTPQDVLKSFSAFVEGVRDALPATRIAYISIKPSPSRMALMPQIRETNTLIERYTHTVANADFIDIFTPMLSAEGTPRTELFREDQLHMNAAGYAIWKNAISEHLN